MANKSQSYGKVLPPLYYQNFRQQGFNDYEIEQAWNACQFNTNLLQNTLQQMRLNQTNFSFAQSDPQLQAALLQSTLQFKQVKPSPTVNPQTRQRNSGVPVGLKNVGNTCYFNCLLQAYFNDHQFVKLILQSEVVDPPPLPNTRTLQEEETYSKLKQCTLMLRSLQKTFSLMIYSDQKYVDPSDVVTNITDGMGYQLPVGDQKDVGEFNCHFLSRISDALDAKKKIQQASKMTQSQILPSLSQSSSRMLDQYFDTQHYSQCGDIQINPRNNSLDVSHITLQQLYIGKTQGVITYQNGGVEVLDLSKIVQKSVTKDDHFSFISINLAHKDLEDCWQDYCFESIDGFRNESGDTVTAQKITSITQAPMTLCFSISRVYYDPNFQEKIMKKHQQLRFPKEIFIDKYMIQNKKQFVQLRNECAKYRFEIESKNREIQFLLNNQSILFHFHRQGQSLTILENIQSVLDYIEKPPSQSTIYEPTAERYPNQRQIQSEISLPKSSNPPQLTPKQQQLASQLRELQQGLSKRKLQLENEIDQLQKKLEKAYSGLNKQKYVLQSILIHDGQYADSGHYYAYIFDFEKKIWRKYDDTNVTEESEQVVFRNSFGGPNAFQSAYFLVYMSEQNIFPKNHKGLLHSFNLESQSAKPDYYQSLVPVPQLQYVSLIQGYHFYQVSQNNKAFQQECVDYGNGILADQVMEEYEIKYSAVQDTIRSIDNELKQFRQAPKPVSIINPCLYLYTCDSQIPPHKKDMFLRYLILESCIKNHHPRKISLRDCQQPAHKGLLAKIVEKCQQPSLQQSIEIQTSGYPEVFQLNKQEEQIFERILEEFTSAQNYAATLIYIYQMVREKNHKKSLIALEYYASLVNESSGRYFQQQKSQLLNLIPVVVFRDVDKSQYKDFAVKGIIELVAGVVTRHLFKEGNKQSSLLALQLGIWLRDLSTRFPSVPNLINIQCSSPKTLICIVSKIVQEQFNTKLEDLNNSIKEMSEKHDIIKWNPIVNEDSFIRLTISFQSYVDSVYAKESKFVSTIINDQQVYETKEREALFK